MPDDHPRAAAPRSEEPPRREHRALPVCAPGSNGLNFVIRGYEELLTRDTVWGEHSHSCGELMWNECGASSAVVGARVWTITPAMGLWMPAGTLHAGTAPAGTRMRAAFFGYRTTSPISDRPVTVEITPLLRLLLDRLDEPELAGRSREVTEAMVLDVLTPAAHELFVHMPKGPLLRPIAEAVRRHPADRRGPTEWAQELGVSARTLARAFSAETGTSFARWVAAVRAQHAIGLLTAGWEVEKVAAEVGYRSASAFGFAFRRTTGLTPGRFRAD
ncbi:AraC family transcriptional regulator [Streptomyces spiramenti]|uniref:Helix-turn-helix transcriptional regulator n=1 Tax=Streptomyces spiramenti TaxID=2720606 RepID=A0ABX1AG75_9ACTN|nr:AraC family transcriptional regulator [Streptomyces spiramenti]NJP64879.1 helix-turn-helix transcriptional regulator [Streptomyces spiramenti]